MRRELKVTLSTEEVSDLLVKVVAKKQGLGEGEYKCAGCSVNANGEMVVVLDLPEKARANV